MQPEKLTIKSQEALQQAQNIARSYSHQEMDGEHLALALISQTDSLIPDLLARGGAPGPPQAGFGKRTGAPPQGAGRGSVRRIDAQEGARCRAVGSDEAE